MTCALAFVTKSYKPRPTFDGFYCSDRAASAWWLTQFRNPETRSMRTPNRSIGTEVVDLRDGWKFGWETWIRTRIARSRIWSPTVGRSPSSCRDPWRSHRAKSEQHILGVWEPPGIHPSNLIGIPKTVNRVPAEILSDVFSGTCMVARDSSYFPPATRTICPLRIRYSVFPHVT